MNVDLAPDLPTNPTLKFPEEPLASPTAGLDAPSNATANYTPPRIVGADHAPLDVAMEILASRERLEMRLLDALKAGVK